MFDLSNTVFGQSIWGDEGFSAILSMKTLPEIIKIIATDTSPPLWNIGEWLVFNTLGTDEIYIRGLAFLYFALTVFFTYKIGRLLFNKKSAIFAAILTFLNPFFFIYAFEGRMYSILALGVTASMYFFLKMYYQPNDISRSTKAGYVISTLWAMYSHHFAIFALFVQGLWWAKEFVFGKRKTSKKIFKLFLVIGLGYLPWMVPLYNQTTKVGGGFWLGTPTPKDLGNIIIEYIAEGIRNDKLVLPVLNIPLYRVAFYVSLTTLVFRKWHKSIAKTTFLMLWFLGPIVLTWAVSQVFQSIFFNRYLLYAIPGAMLIVASLWRKQISSTLTVVLIVVFALIDLNYFVTPAKLPFRQMASWVKSTQKEGDLLINWNAGSHHLWETKYYGIPAQIYVPGGGELPFFVGTALMENSDILNSIPPQTERVGIVTSGSVDEIDLPGYTEEKRKTLRPKAGNKELHFIWYLKN